MKDIFAFRYLFKGSIFLFKNRMLFKYIILQICTGLLLFSLFFVSAATNGMSIYDNYFLFLYEDSSFWYNSLYYILILPFFLILFAAGTYFTFLITQLVVSPINSLLAQKTSKLYKGDILGDDRPFFKGLLKDMRYEFIKLVLFTSVYLLLFTLVLIPFFGGVLFIVLSTAFTIFSLTFEFIELSMDRERTSVKHRLSLLLKKPVMVVSYGGAIFLLFTLPVVGIVLYPVVIIGAVLLYEDRIATDSENIKQIENRL